MSPSSSADNELNGSLRCPVLTCEALKPHDAGDVFTANRANNILSQYRIWVLLPALQSLRKLASTVAVSSCSAACMSVLGSAISQIVPGGAKEQVVRITATWGIAPVTDIKVSGINAKKEKVGNSVSADITAAHDELPVALWFERCGPKPTIVVRSAINLLPKTIDFLWRRLRNWFPVDHETLLSKADTRRFNYTLNGGY